MSTARQERTGYYNPTHKIAHRGYTILRREFNEGYLVDGHKVHEHYIVSDATGFLNMAPGAAWFQTVANAKLAIDDLIAVNEWQGRPSPAGTAAVADCPDFDSDAFWGKVRVRSLAQAKGVGPKGRAGLDYLSI